MDLTDFGDPPDFHTMRFTFVVVDVCFKPHMACILLTDMDPPVSGPTAHLNGHLPDFDPATGLDPKQDTDASCLTVHLYYLGKDGGGVDTEHGSESALTYPPGEYIAEELCISAAKACVCSVVEAAQHTIGNSFQAIQDIFYQHCLRKG